MYYETDNAHNCWYAHVIHVIEFLNKLLLILLFYLILGKLQYNNKQLYIYVCRAGIA